jgi:proliferating cell nuclear antigen
MKILEVVTTHAGPIKLLVDVLKDLLQEANIEFIRKTVDDDTSTEKDEKTVEEDTAKEDTAKEDTVKEDKKKKKKKKTDDSILDLDELKKKKKKKKKKKGDEEDELIDDELIEDELIEEDKEEITKETKEATETKVTKKKEKGGLRLTAVDLTKTVLINLKLDANEFDVFKCKKKKITVGINLGYLHKLLKTMDSDDNLTLYQEHDNKNYLNIKIDNNVAFKETEFDLKLLEIQKEKLLIPEISFEAVVTISAHEFHRLCREMKHIADYVEIKCLKNKIIFSCRGDGSNRTTTYKTDDKINTVNIEHSHTDDSVPFIIQGVFELKNLVMFTKCAALCPNIEIYLKNNYAIIIKYTIASLGRLLLCLSPVKEDTIKNTKYEDDEFYSEDEIVVKS